MAAPPFVLPLDADGKFVNAGAGREMGTTGPHEPSTESTHDHKNIVWIGRGGVRRRRHVVEVTLQGKFLAQSARGSVKARKRGHRELNRPADIFVECENQRGTSLMDNGNRRVAVFDARHGAFKGCGRFRQGA